MEEKKLKYMRPCLHWINHVIYAVCIDNGSAAATERGNCENGPGVTATGICDPTGNVAGDQFGDICGDGNENDGTPGCGYGNAAKSCGGGNSPGSSNTYCSIGNDATYNP